MIALFICIFYFFYFALVAIYIVFLPKMFSISGYDASHIGALFAAAPAMRFILPFIFRQFGGLNHTLFNLALVVLFTSSALFIPALQNFYALFALNLVYGAAMGMILPYVDTIALHYIEKERYGKVRLWGSIGFMLMALWLGKVLQTVEQSLLYFTLAALATMLSGWYIGRYENSSSMAAKSPQKSGEGESFSISRYWAFWLAAFLLQVSFGAFYNFFTIYETAHGISLEMSSWLWSFGVICEIVMLYFQGPLLRRNLLSIIEFATFATALRWFALWYYPDSLPVAFLSQSLHAVSFALYYSAAISYIYGLYREKKLAQQFFLGISFGLGGSVGALSAGWFYEVDAKNLFLYQSLIALMAWYMMRVHSERRREYESI